MGAKLGLAEAISNLSQDALIEIFTRSLRPYDPFQIKVYWERDDHLQGFRLDVRVFDPLTEKRWGYTHRVSDHWLKDIPSSGQFELLTSTILTGARENFIRQITPHLYSYDPRIGVPFGQLKAAPLFDNQKVFNQAIHFQKLVAESPHSWGVDTNFEVGINCPFCGKSISESVASAYMSRRESNVVWGSSAVGWCHAECHPKTSGHPDISIHDL